MKAPGLSKYEKGRELGRSQYSKIYEVLDK
jgi:hypothetical protein